jgi:hypothetical protein
VEPALHRTRSIVPRRSAKNLFQAQRSLKQRRALFATWRRHKLNVVEPEDRRHTTHAQARWPIVAAEPGAVAVRHAIQ